MATKQPHDFVVEVRTAQRAVDETYKSYQDAIAARTRIFSRAITVGGMTAYGISKALDGKPTPNRVARLMKAAEPEGSTE